VDECADFHELLHALRCLPQHGVGAQVGRKQRQRSALMSAAAPQHHSFAPSERVGRAASGGGDAAHHARANIGSECAIRTNS
jgi:hypothetical protein